ncbi:MAG: ribonuclease P protein component [Bacteroidota bacterium]|nr:ribonuclease P protein component [Bacteroidota bacterium]
MGTQFTYNRKEKLKSRKVLSTLFAEGKSISVFPVKVFYLPVMDEKAAVIQTGVGVSARNFKKAVDRNRIKRLLRECYRLNKTPLHATAMAKEKKMAFFFLYIGKEVPDYVLLDEKMKTVITKLETILGN